MDELDAPVLYHHDESMPPVEPGIFGFSRRSLIVGGAAALTAFLAACSSDSKSSSTTAGSSGATTTTAAPGTTAGSAGTTTAGTGAATTAAGSSPASAVRTEAKTETITIGVPSLQEAFVDPHWAVGGLIFPLLWAISEPLY